MVLPSRKSSILSVLLALALLTFLCAGAFAPGHEGHDCTGKDCPVCLRIEIFQNLLKIFIPAILARLFCGSPEQAAGRAETSLFRPAFPFSPITSKVKFLF
jgi:hypothetical protein